MRLKRKILCLVLSFLMLTGSVSLFSSCRSSKGSVSLDFSKYKVIFAYGVSEMLEDCIYDLISQCEEVLSDKPLFFAVNSYTTGLSPAVMEYMLKTTLVPRFGGQTSCDEIGLPVSATGGVVPCGATAIWEE